ncbi:MAG: PD40 domain-containing protein [Saprospiraceae bacterium]|nr:PD40 domain-containing protein [Saprospiraceae bacterium]
MFVVISLNRIVCSQTASQKSILEVAQQSMASKNYYDALFKYQELLEFDNNNINYLYNAAEAARLNGAYDKAKEYYESVMKHQENNQFPLASFFLARVKQLMGEYQSSKMSYLMYRTEHGIEGDYYSVLADKEIKACEWAINQLNKCNTETKLKRLGEAINSDFSDFAATGTEEHLNFSSNRFENLQRTEKPKRFVSKLLMSNNGSIGEAYRGQNSEFKGKNVCNATFLNTHSWVIFNVCEDLNDYDKRCLLYSAKIDTAGNWYDVSKLPDNINIIEYTQTQPSLSFDSLTQNITLYFSSDRPGGRGGLDIWSTVLDNAGNFSEPVNLKNINTAEDEITPFFNASTSILYFSSRGHLGFGGFDIYSSKKSSSNVYSVPSNLNCPINSSFDDVYYFLSDNNKGLFSSNRKESKVIDNVNNACCLDIYLVELPKCDVKLKALVYDLLTNQNLNGATLSLSEIGNPSATPIIIKQENSNEFSIPLDCDKEYKVEASKPGYTTESTSFLSGRPGEFKEITKKLYLKQEKVRLNVLTFDKQTGLDLTGCTVRLIDLDDSTFAPIELNNLNSNVTEFPEIKNCHRYKIIASKDKYGIGRAEINIDCNAKGLIEQKIYLDKYLYSLLPVKLYFDNDKPIRSTKSTSTNLSYMQTYKAYSARKNIFVKRYCSLKSTVNKLSCKAEMDSFFRDEVDAGKDQFDKFMNELLADLVKGKKYKIFVKGYASPLAANQYNFNLGKRRIHSITNEFEKWNKGVLFKYIKSGKLIITEYSFGEETSPANVPWEPKDPGSIYTIEASKERRVEILEIRE